MEEEILKKIQSAVESMKKGEEEDLYLIDSISNFLENVDNLNSLNRVKYALQAAISEVKLLLNLTNKDFETENENHPDLTKINILKSWKKSVLYMHIYPIFNPDKIFGL